MTDGRSEKYRLYAMAAGDKPSDTEFYFLMPDVDLVYTQHAPESAVEITEPEQLPGEAREWLLHTIDDITARYLRDNEAALLEGTKTFTEKFREELERERKRTAGNSRTVRVKARVQIHGDAE